MTFPLPRIEVTEHQVEVKICSCGRKNKAFFLATVRAPVQYVTNIQAFVVYLQSRLFILEECVQTFFKGFCNISISEGTLAIFLSKFAQKLVPFEASLKEHVNSTSAENVDETGYTVDGKTQWLPVVSTGKATIYSTAVKRSSLPEGLLPGILIHDHCKPCFIQEDVEHGLCNAHHLRELKAVEELDKESWGER